MVTCFNKWLLALALPLLLCSARSAETPHPLHVSVVEVNHNAKDKTIEVSCKLFTDDFESILEKNYHVKVDLINPPDRAATDKLVSDYIGKHFSLKADGKALSLSYLGFERDEDATYCYFQADNIASVKKVEVRNTLMHDMFTDEVNLIHVIVGGQRKSTKLDYPNADASVSF